MEKKHLKIIEYLAQCNDYRTSKQIAEASGFSIRSVKNFIREINLQQQIILSSRNGYKLLDKKWQQFNTDLESTYDNRAIYIIKSFFINRTNDIDIIDISEELYVSESTIKKDIIKMNKTYGMIGVNFKLSGNTLKLTGNEKQIRKLFSLIIYEESKNDFLDIKRLEEKFSGLNAEAVVRIINKNLNRYNYYLNNMALFNVVLHVLIMIDRIQSSKYIGTAVLSDFNINSRIIDQISKDLEACFEIVINEVERKELSMLIEAYANISIDIKDIKKYIHEEIFELTQKIIYEIDKNYFINVNTTEFFIPFSLHLKNLIQRLKEGRCVNNPMNDILEKENLLIYDIAIFVASRISNYVGIQVPSDEIGFIAIHLGSEINRQEATRNIISVFLLLPTYLDINRNLHTAILRDFENKIQIKRTIENIEEIENEDFDLLISTMPINEFENKLVCVSPIYTREDYRKIDDKIEEIIMKKKSMILTHKFNDYFLEELFMSDEKEITKDDVLKSLCNNLIKKGYVNYNFHEEILKRESASSTSFFSVAIPHSMEMDAIRTCISVYINRKGINWNGKIIYVVFMVAINKIARNNFTEIYEALVNIFSDDKNTELIKLSQTFDEFKKNLHLVINADE